MSRPAGSHKPRQSEQSWGRLGRLLGRSALPRHDCGWEACLSWDWRNLFWTVSTCYLLPRPAPVLTPRHLAPVLNTLSPCVSSRRLMFAAGNIFTTTEILSRDGAERRRRVAARCGCGVGFVIMTAIKSDFWTERSAVQRNSSPGFRARDRIIRREAKTVKMVKFIVITLRLPII